MPKTLPKKCMPRREWEKVRLAIDSARVPAPSHCHPNITGSSVTLCVTLRSREATADGCLDVFAEHLRKLADELAEAQT